MMQQERDDAMAQRAWLDRQRFRPRQWSSRLRWKVYRPNQGDRWYGFHCVRELAGLPPEILLVPLRGHTYGHAGVAIQTPQRWLLHSGDAYFYHQEMDRHDPWCTPGFRFYQSMMEKDRDARFTNQARLRQLRHAHGEEVEVFCSHDPSEFERLAGHTLRESLHVDFVPPQQRSGARIQPQD